MLMPPCYNPERNNDPFIDKYMRLAIKLVGGNLGCPASLVNKKIKFNNDLIIRLATIESDNSSNREGGANLAKRSAVKCFHTKGMEAETRQVSSNLGIKNAPKCEAEILLLLYSPSQCILSIASSFHDSLFRRVYFEL